LTEIFSKLENLKYKLSRHNKKYSNEIINTRNNITV